MYNNPTLIIRGREGETWNFKFHEFKNERERERNVTIARQKISVIVSISWLYQIFYNMCPLFRCDRILSYGKGIRLLTYKRSELRFSDHRPVSAAYMAEVEVFSARRLQRALTIMDAEIEDEEILADTGVDVGMNFLRVGKVTTLLCA